jgi:hypothetical protein
VRAQQGIIVGHSSGDQVASSTGGGGVSVGVIKLLLIHMQMCRHTKMHYGEKPHSGLCQVI